MSEVVLGLMFRPLPLRAHQLARLHDIWGTDYPRIEEHPAIPAMAQPGFFFEVQGAPDLRLWFVSDASGRLIQTQKDRVILNWRWQSAEQQYPRYRGLRQELVRRVSEFRSFLATIGIDGFSPVATEVTYINTIGSDEYTKFSDALNFVTNPPHLHFEPVDANLQLRFDTAEMLERESNLIITASRDNSRDPAPISLQLSSHAQTNGEDFLAALDRSHDLIVTSFRDITTDSMHGRWGFQK